jgi:hypothetical protein
MARIRTSGTADALRVRVAGRLTMEDMGRLEHACAPALVRHPLQLELDLRAVTSLDATARAVIGCFTARGATVVAQTPVPSTAVHGGRRKRDRAERLVT